MKRKLVFLLVAVMLASMFAACGSSGTTTSSGGATTSSGTTDTPAADGGIEISAPGELPIVKETVPLSIFAMQNVNVEDYDDNKMTNFMEEQTGVEISWQLVPEKDGIQKINLMLASQTDLPDVFMNNQITADVVADMADQGVFIPLDDMIEQDGFWYKEAMEKDPLLATINVLPDGKRYTMPRVVKSVPNETSGRGWINKVWLDNLGLDIPTTTDEFYEVLKAFKTGDPNGNGKADEIPMIGASVTGWHSNPDEFLMNSFIQYNRDMPVHIRDGEIRASFDKPEFRQGLIYMNMLCSEGLLDGASFTQDQTQLKQIFDNEDDALIGFVPGGGTFQYASMDEERVREYIPLSPLKGPEGVQLAWYNPYGSYGVTDWAITNACENPRVAFKFADYMYSREVSMRNRLGEPGVDYLIPTNGEIAVDGEEATYIPVLLWGSVQKSHWNERGPAYNDFDNNLVKGDNPYELQLYLWTATKDYYTPYIPAVENCYNNLTFYTTEDARALSDVWSTLRDFGREYVAKFTTGVVDPNDDKAWEQYIKELENVGYLDWLAIMQARYDSANA